MIRVVKGDLVQWESQGIFMFQAPHTVKEVTSHGDKCFVLVEGGPTGIPIDQVRVITRCKEHYGDGVWRCPECQTGWDAGILHKSQIGLPCYCPHDDEKLVFEHSV